MGDINLEKRSKVLEYALLIEEAINTLLQNHLLILDQKVTRNFSGKSGISFKSKVDLLFDIEVLTKEECIQIELLMNFRNKFVHDIKSNSFTHIFVNFDPGIQNRFRKFLNPNVVEENEHEYEVAYRNLYYETLKILQSKFRIRKEEIINYSNFQSENYDIILDLSDESISFLDEIVKEIEQLLSDNPELDALISPLLQRSIKFFLNMCSIQSRIYENMKLHDKLPKKVNGK